MRSTKESDEAGKIAKRDNPNIRSWRHENVLYVLAALNMYKESKRVLWDYWNNYTVTSCPPSSGCREETPRQTQPLEFKPGALIRGCMLTKSGHVFTPKCEFSRNHREKEGARRTDRTTVDATRTQLTFHWRLVALRRFHVECGNELYTRKQPLNPFNICALVLSQLSTQVHP